MRILVAGTGRSGSCLLSTVIVGLKAVKMKPGEDRKFFKYKILPKNYGTKIGAIPEWGFTLNNVIKALQHHPDLFVIYSIRHPVDMFMSKIVRGQKPSDGGDRDLKNNIISVDGTVDGALSRIEYFYHIYIKTKTMFPNRILTVKMEDLVLMPKEEVGRIAKFLNVEPTQEAFQFYKHNYNKYHNKRYGTTLHESTINIHEQWDTWHNGFFKNKGDDIKKATDYLVNITRDLGYEP